MIKKYMALTIGLAALSGGWDTKGLKFSNKGDWYKPCTTHKHRVKQKNRKKR